MFYVVIYRINNKCHTNCWRRIKQLTRKITFIKIGWKISILHVKREHLLLHLVSLVLFRSKKTQLKWTFMPNLALYFQRRRLKCVKSAVEDNDDGGKSKTQCLSWPFQSGLCNIQHICKTLHTHSVVSATCL